MKKIVKAMAILALATITSLRASAQVRETAWPEYYIQYMPVAVDLALPLTGVKAENPFVERVIAAASAYAINAAVVQATKFLVDEQRPDGTAHNSFPSGHTSTAFVGAELVRHEYGWGWGAGAYAAATSVAVLRVYHQRHWWWDTVAGAGLGILSANAGYWILKPTRKLLKGRKDDSLGMISLAPTVDVMSGTPCASMTWRF